MATGFLKTVANSGRADRAIVLRGGSQAEINSPITRDNMLTILVAAGVRRDASCKPIGCGELVTVVNMPKIDDGNSSDVAFRGSCGQPTQFRPQPKFKQRRSKTERQRGRK